MRLSSNIRRAPCHPSTTPRRSVVSVWHSSLYRSQCRPGGCAHTPNWNLGTLSASLGHRRCLSQSSLVKAREEHNPQLPPNSQDSDFPIFFTSLPKTSSTKSQIRESLRAWSVQNERIKQEQTPDTLPYEGRITRLPNALFLAPSQSELGNTLHDQGHDPWYNLEDDTAENTSGGEFIKPGTLVWHMSELVRPQNVVYIGTIGAQSLLLLSNGKWAADRLRVKRNNISKNGHVPVPDFLSQDEIELFRSHMPQQDVTRAIEEGGPQVPINVMGSLPDHLFATVFPRFQNVKDVHERFVRDHKVQLEQMYDTLAYQDKWRKIPVQELPPLVLGTSWDSLDGLEQKAFVWHANRFHPLFIPTQSANTITYFIGPKSLDFDMKLVQGWSRLYQDAAARAAVGQDVSIILRHNPLAAFIDKARRIILKARKIRVPTNMGILGPSIRETGPTAFEKVPTGETFTADDKKIIYYLWDMAYRRPKSNFPFAHASLIARAIGAYPDLVLDSHAIRMLLQELGCADPWTQPDDIDLSLPGRQVDHGMDEIKRKADLSLRANAEGADSTSLLIDSMAGLRKDWGNTEAICIDSKFSDNLEDAISVEPADEVEGAYWIHAHISHPTAYLNRDHPIAQLARKQGSAFYNHHEDEPILTMIPDQLVKYCSLHNSKNVLTISTLISQDGSVHKVEVVPGTLRNMIRLSSAAYKALQRENNDAPGQDADEAVLVVGQVSRLPQANDAAFFHDFRLNKDMAQVRKQLPKLKLLSRLLTARFEKRKEEMPIASYTPTVSKSITTRLRVPEPYRADRMYDSYHWKGDPGIAFWAKRVIESNLDSGSSQQSEMLASVMRLTSESLGKWFAERRIPAVFLGTDLTLDHSVQQTREGGLKQPAPQLQFLRSAEPKPYHTLNMAQFAGCTSPSRRFIDMMAHFQIDSYLQAEAQGRVGRGAPVEDESVLAFSTADVQDYIAVDAASTDSLAASNTVTDRFWGYQALFRAFHFKEAVLPEVLEMMVDFPARRGVDGRNSAVAGTLVPWSFRVELEPSPEGYEKKADYQEFLPIKILRIDFNAFKIHGLAIGPPTAQQQFKEQIKCYTSENFCKLERSRYTEQLSNQV